MCPAASERSQGRVELYVPIAELEQNERQYDSRLEKPRLRKPVIDPRFIAVSSPHLLSGFRPRQAELGLPRAARETGFRAPDS